MSAGPMQCSLSGAEHAGADVDEVCAAFQQAIARISSPKPMQVEVEALSTRSARAIARADSGEAILTLDFDVSDRSLGPSVWETFARDFASQLARSANQAKE